MSCLIKTRYLGQYIECNILPVCSLRRDLQICKVGDISSMLKRYQLATVTGFASNAMSSKIGGNVHAGEDCLQPKHAIDENAQHADLVHRQGLRHPSNSTRRVPCLQAQRRYSILRGAYTAFGCKASSFLYTCRQNTNTASQKSSDAVQTSLSR